MTVDSLAPASLREIVRFLGRQPGRPRLRWTLAFLFTVAVVMVAMLGSASLLGFAVDALGNGSLPWLLALVAVALLAEAAGRAVAGYLLTAKARVLSMDLRRAGLTSVLRAPVPEVLELGTGNVITRLTKDIDQAVMLLNIIGLRLVVTILVLPFTIISMLLISPYYAILFLVSGLLMWPGLKGVLRHLPHTANVLSTAEARRNNLMLDTIRGLPTLQALQRGDWALERMKQGSWNAVIAQERRVPLFARLIVLGSVVYALLLIGTLVMSAWLVDSGQLSLGAATAATVLVVRLEMHVFNVLFFAGQIQESMVGVGRAVSLATLADGADKPRPAQVTAPPSVELEDVSFGYGGGLILENLNLTLAAGTTTALVGASGAGKSTVAALIAGLQRPTAGKIRVAGEDVSQISDAWLAETVTLISQEVHLFAGSVRQDLRMAGDFDDAELISALGAAGLVEGSAQWRRAFPQGLDTRIGAGAAEVSPEVAQQVSLARVILRDPPVLIMDEATAEAGSDHARALETAAQTVARGRTSLVVAHRLDQAQLADRVLFMEQGKIIEDGSHEQLMQLGGHYAELFQQWQA